MKHLLLCAIAIAIFTGCSCRDEAKACVGCPTAAICVMEPTATNTVAGALHFTPIDGGVVITGTITGLKPSAKHAMHIHEFGDISSKDGTAAGGHYNPEGHDHGGPDQAIRHAGDLGNIQSDAAGKSEINQTVKGLSLCKGGIPIIGRSIVIHTGEDDLTSQPSGNAGPRASVGVIGIAKGAAKGAAK